MEREEGSAAWSNLQKLDHVNNLLQLQHPIKHPNVAVYQLVPFFNRFYNPSFCLTVI
jgi:hypothetical protein